MALVSTLAARSVATHLWDSISQWVACGDERHVRKLSAATLMSGAVFRLDTTLPSSGRRGVAAIAIAGVLTLPITRPSVAQTRNVATDL